MQTQMRPSSVKSTAVADVIIQKLASAGDPPAAPRVQALMVLVAATWLSKHPGARPWDDRLIRQDDGNVVWPELRSALAHHKGHPIVPPENRASAYYGNNQVSQNEAQPCADLLQCVEAVLDEHSGTSPYTLWKRIYATPAVRHAAPSEFATTTEIDLMALAEQLSPAPALA